MIPISSLLGLRADNLSFICTFNYKKFIRIMISKGFLKNIFFALLLFIITKPSFSQEVIVKEIEFKLDYISENSYENEYFITLKLTKGLSYVFKVLNHIDDYAGEAIVELLDGDNLVSTNYVGEKYYEQCMFQCNKTGFYDVLIRFKDNKLGNSKIDIFMKQ